MAQCMRHAPLDVFTPSCLDMHGEYILTRNYLTIESKNIIPLHFFFLSPIINL
jgi:hypothetical protein